jgi:hypothetical protein
MSKFISKDNIFKLFEFENMDVENDDLSELGEVLVFIKVGMFIKTIENREVFYFKLKDTLEQLKNNNIELQDYSQSIIYNKAFSYLCDIDLQHPLVPLFLKKYKVKKLIECLNKSILYFENLEEYEKCSILYNIKKVIEK